MDTDDIHHDETSRRDASKLAGDVIANDVKWLMSSKQGRRIARRWLGETGIYRTSFTGNSETFFREGKRAFGLFLTEELTRHAFQDYLLMLNEGNTK
jgi:hypothetical protein